jgi:hypothetical protein
MAISTTFDSSSTACLSPLGLMFKNLRFPMIANSHPVYSVEIVASGEEN